MAPRVAFALSLILVIGHFEEGPASLVKTFTFPEYPYKETTKNVSPSSYRTSVSASWISCGMLIQVIAATIA